MLTFLTNPYFVALGIPTLFIAAGGMGKKLVRGKKGWQRNDWYLGTELILGSLSASLVQIFDLIKKVPQAPKTAWPPELPIQIAASSGFIAVSFFCFIWVLSTHQDWHDASDKDKRMQIWWLGIFCNTIGAILMIAFILAIKGI
jgi:hypothetical protein